MSIRNATLTTAALLALGLNAGAISSALAGEDCGRMKAAHGHSAHGYPPMAGFVSHGHGYPRPPMMDPYGMQPAMYWGTQPPTLMKTALAETAASAPGDIVDVAIGAGSFRTLVAAVQAAGLVETLKGEGPFTVFAPTDEAFGKIPREQLDALLADKEALVAVLTYHVVPGKVMAADVAGLDKATTVQGSTLAIDTSDGVKVDGATVVQADIETSNGVIHVIDAVMMPE